MNTIKKDDFVTVAPEIMHGTPVFKGTRVPIDTLQSAVPGQVINIQQINSQKGFTLRTKCQTNLPINS